MSAFGPKRTSVVAPQVESNSNKERQTATKTPRLCTHGRGGLCAVIRPMDEGGGNAWANINIADDSCGRKEAASGFRYRVSRTRASGA